MYLNTKSFKLFFRLINSCLNRNISCMFKLSFLFHIFKVNSVILLWKFDPSSVLQKVFSFRVSVSGANVPLGFPAAVYLLQVKGCKGFMAQQRHKQTAAQPESATRNQRRRLSRSDPPARRARRSSRLFLAWGHGFLSGCEDRKTTHLERGVLTGRRMTASSDLVVETSSKQAELHKQNRRVTTKTSWKGGTQTELKQEFRDARIQTKTSLNFN